MTWVDTSKLKRTIMEYNDEVFGVAVDEFPVLTFLLAAR